MKPTIRELIQGISSTAPVASGLALAERVEAVVRLHKQFKHQNGQVWCEHCTGLRGTAFVAEWPCATVRALNGEPLHPEQTNDDLGER